MPLSELLRLTKGKPESGEHKPCPPRVDDGLVELVWENGQVVAEPQPRSSTSRVTVTDANRKFQSMFEDMSPVVPSEDLGLSQDDDHGMVPLLRNYSSREYSYGPLPREVSGVTANGTSSRILSAKGTHQLCSWPSASKALRSGVSDADQCRQIINDSTTTTTEKQTKLLNFCHFSRPASRVPDRIPAVESRETNRAAKTVDSMLRIRSNNVPKHVYVHASSSQLSVNNHRQLKETCLPERMENIETEPSGRNDKLLISTNTENSTNGVPEGRINIEPAVASSSVGSGNSTDRVSCEKTDSSKRKFCDIDDSECHSDDIETESFGVKKLKPVRGVTGSKRSRAAEVHNLSERRRRDRINEKMRALQELIPNCNKVDKASMLDEAIEYLKTLQLQVQIMSIGAGMCMPPMMFQHMLPAHFPGMGPRYGMGMLDMNNRIPGCPIFPFPPPMSVPNSFQKIPAPAYGQGLYSSVAGAPSVPLPAQPPITSAMDTSGLKNGIPNNVACMNVSSQPMFHAKATWSMDKSNQTQATNEVLNHPCVAQEKRKDATGRRATRTDFKETGYDD